MTPEQDLQECGNIVVILDDNLTGYSFLTSNFLYKFDIEIKSINVMMIPKCEAVKFDFETIRKKICQKLDTPETYAILASERTTDEHYKKYLERLFEN